MKRFFSYAPDQSGVMFHDTAEAAEAEAKECLDELRKDAHEEGEWSDSTSSVCWGEIRQAATEQPDKFLPYVDFNLASIQA